MSSVRTLSRISASEKLSLICTVIMLSAATRLYSSTCRTVGTNLTESAPKGCLRRATSRRARVSLSTGTIRA
ncbi:hypothetical protein HD554DRAFT_2134799 [Boletus coccyginus]|nr:hypothetical protein HD554DRAFT_2134799 [Boletus coccyginus]